MSGTVTLYIEGQTLTGPAYDDYMQGYRNWIDSRGPTARFEVGETYLRNDGAEVTCIKLHDLFGRRSCALFSDSRVEADEDGRFHLLGYRYDRDEDRGRLTASRWDNPHNVIPRAAR